MCVCVCVYENCNKNNRLIDDDVDVMCDRVVWYSRLLCGCEKRVVKKTTRIDSILRIGFNIIGEKTRQNKLIFETNFSHTPTKYTHTQAIQGLRMIKIINSLFKSVFFGSDSFIIDN